MIWRKKHEKLICLCLVVLLCFSIASPAFASQNDTFSTKIRAIAHSHGVSSASLQAQAVLDQNSFKRLGYDSSVITPCDLNKDSNIVYEIMFGDVVNQIAIRTDTNGDLVFDFYEDALHTEVRLTNNDELLVNGTLIPAPEIKESSETILAALNTESSGTITPRARYDQWSTSPFFSASSYTNYIDDYKRNTVSWGVSTLVGLTIGAVVTIVMSALSVVCPALSSLTVQVGISVLSGFASAMISYCEIYGMQDAYYSFSFTKYSSTDSVPTQLSYKYIGACYSQRNYKGTRYPHVMYQLNYFA